jgi:hypothetical protein
MVVDRTQSGSQIKRLNELELETWLNEYSLGQLWDKQVP